MKTLRLTYNNRKHQFEVESLNRGFGKLCVPAAKSERDDVIEHLSRRIMDDPSMQVRLGILGEDSFDIR